MPIIATEVSPVHKFLGNTRLCIPEFQRPYKWSVKNVIQLIADIERFKHTQAYRIGTVVIYKEKEACNIVDGQQRTITFLLMLKAIFKAKLPDIDDDTLRKKIAGLHEQCFNPSFNSEISKRNIRENYREIERRVAACDERFIDFFLNNCEVTTMVIDDVSEAFQFFDSQNARGKDLEPHDLLKAFHLRELEASPQKLNEQQTATLVSRWESMEITDLSKLFADFLFRVRGWSKGDSSRYFTKKDTSLFKGINLATAGNYPYVQMYQMLSTLVEETGNADLFPFQLDQVIINGRYFFDMIARYAKLTEDVMKKLKEMSGEAAAIINTIDSYPGRNRTGDKYVRMLFNCAVLYFIDKFGEQELPAAIQKIFIWAYSPRLTYQSLQLASVDNYVINEFNLFKIIREAIYSQQITSLELPLITDDFKNEKTMAIRNLFVNMKYYANAN
jgi:hypothetical protein